MVPRTEADAPDRDEPIPEVQAELDADRERHEAFLAVVRGMLQPDHGTTDTDDSDRPDEDELGDPLPGLHLRRPRRRRLRLALAGELVAGAAALPWAVPEVPGLLGDLVPGEARTATVADPPVAPPTDAFVGPVGVTADTGSGDVRLEAAGQPRRVVVPRLHVDSPVLPISGQSGSLLPPADPQVLGWWQEGREVGAREGSAVVTGHTVHTGGGALDNLDKLVVGDSLRVRTDRGWIRYVVQRARIYSTAELARDADEVFRLGGPGRLVLITCDDWNGESYESNAVVFASPVAGQPAVPDVETTVPDGGPTRGSR
jgi:LPXTG-site transpeptidase (sortase) family protein